MKKCVGSSSPRMVGGCVTLSGGELQLQVNTALWFTHMSRSSSVKVSLWRPLCTLRSNPSCTLTECRIALHTEACRQTHTWSLLSDNPMKRDVFPFFPEKLSVFCYYPSLWVKDKVHILLDSHTHTCTHAHSRAHTHAHTHTHTHTHTHKHTHTHTPLTFSTLEQFVQWEITYPTGKTSEECGLYISHQVSSPGLMKGWPFWWLNMM